MSEQIEKAAADILTRAANSVSDGVGFLTAQIPDLAQQLLAFKLTGNILEILLMLGLIATFAMVMKRFHKVIDWDSPLAFIGGMACACLGFLFVVVIFCDVQEILKIIIAPKIYLIEYAAKLAGGK